MAKESKKVLFPLQLVAGTFFSPTEISKEDKIAKKTLPKTQIQTPTNKTNKTSHP